MTMTKWSSKGVALNGILQELTFFIIAKPTRSRKKGFGPPLLLFWRVVTPLERLIGAEHEASTALNFMLKM